MLEKIQYIYVNIVEGHTDARQGLATLINSTYGYHILHTYSTCLELLEGLKEKHPDVILIGADCFGDQCEESVCIKYISKIKNLSPKVKIIVFTQTDKEEIVFQILKAGADGYLTKDTPPARLLESIREVYEGGAPLSPAIARAVVSSFHKRTSSVLSTREVQVLELLAKGKTYPVIAEKLFIDKETARTHIKNIYWKLEVHSKAEAIEKALYEKII